MEPYPLQWPVGYPRTETPGFNNGFRRGTSFAVERDELLDELKRLKATEIVLSSNVPIRKDGLPFSEFNRSSITDRGVAVYFKMDREPQVLCCDAWNTWEHNMRALTKTIEALRGLERWGASEILKRAFSGLKALPEPGFSQTTWWEILNVAQNATFDTITASWRELVKKYHGQDDNAFIRVHKAYQEAKKARGQS